jgi:hypothetical protein
MRRPTTPPIAADLGESAIHAIQLSDAGCEVAAALSLDVDWRESFDPDAHLTAARAAVDQLAASDAWAGRRMIIALPAALVSMAHLRLEPGEDVTLAAQSRLPDIGPDPMVRTIDVSSPWKSGRGCRELLCLAMPRDAVLRYVAMLHDCKVDIAGIYTPASMMLRAFSHVNRRDSDADVATMYVELDRHNTTVAFGQGASLVAARSISIAATTSAAARVDLPAAPLATVSADTAGPSGFLDTISRRSNQESPSTPRLEAGAPANEAPAALCEELRTCMRHYQGLFSEIPIQRIVFTGPGALEAAPCCAMAQALHLPAQIGDPLAQWDSTSTASGISDWARQLRPQWSVAAGLAAGADEESTS